MTRIRTDQPSSGKPLLLFVPSGSNNGFVNTTWGTIAEAPDFSIPSSGDDTAIADPVDNGRELRPGEVFFETPLQAINTTATSRWVELRIVLQGVSGQEIPATPRIVVPAGESVYLAIQGLRLLKTSFPAAVTAGSFVVGQSYQIISVGDTSFTDIGASGNTVGVTFTATGVGSGTGTAALVSAGGRLQVQAEVNNAIKVIGSAVELEAQDHAPDTEAI
jgi:hypothetical protein